MTTTACAQPGLHRSHPRRLLRRLRVARTRVGRRSATPQGRRPPRRPASSSRCTQPGCSGTIVDGYCDVCGSPGPQGAQGAGGTRRPPPRSPRCRPARRQSPSTVSRTSDQLATAALGSARAGADGSKATRRVGTSSTRLRGARLGAGLTSIPPVAAVDAAGAVLKDPMVPEDRRTCPSCGSPVGRSRDGQPGRTEGFCPACRNPFSFTPKLQEGDVVGGQYVVAGAIAHGGLGWIYAARDRNVSDRWVVLKGLLNSGDPDALAAAIAERQFLAQVEHPLIVEIYNFVTHEGAGYIVMEYVGGTSLKQLLKDRMRAAGGAYDPLPVDQAIAFVIEVLPAFQYLHDLNLVYCDFKPDNLIQVGDAVKLIDLGGVRRLDDLDSAIYGTTGYQAPEVPHVGPSVASDIYTIGRTLTVLAMEFRGYQNTYVALAAHRSTRRRCSRSTTRLYRLLLKACAPDPADRFVSADELRVQLLGVLREVVALGREGAAEHSTSSLLFDVPTVADDSLDWQDLPRLRTDDGDPQMPWLRTVSIDDPVQRLAALEGAPANSPEVLLARARAALDAGPARPGRRRGPDAARRRPLGVAGRVDVGPGRPRPAPDGRGAGRVQRGLRAGARRAGAQAGPGVRLRDRRRHRRRRVALRGLCPHATPTTSPRPRSASPGSASGRGDVAGAVRALDLVPGTSRAFTQARRRRAGLLAGSGGGLPSLAAALDSIESLTIDPVDRSRFRVDVLSAALGLVESHGADTTVVIAGRPAAEPALRDGLEAAYRDLAGYASQPRGADPPRRPGQRGPPMDAAMTGPGRTGPWHPPVQPSRTVATGALSCPSCAGPVAAGERFCEACGADLGPAGAGCRRTPVPEQVATTSTRACRECGGDVADDGYCTQCGARAASPRNHFTEQPAPWVAAVCDRGVRHTRNEDAVALDAGPEPGGHAVLVVCDGVSSSTDSDVASLAAARAARDVLAVSSPAGRWAPPPPAPRRAPGPSCAAADAANEAVIAHTTPGPGNPASCTFVAAVVDRPAPRRGLGR